MTVVDVDIPRLQRGINLLLEIAQRADENDYDLAYVSPYMIAHLLDFTDMLQDIRDAGHIPTSSL